MFTFLFVPPRDSAGVRGFFWSLVRELSSRTPQAACVVPDGCLYSKTAPWLKESRLRITTNESDSRDAARFVYTDDALHDFFVPEAFVFIGVSPTVEGLARARMKRSFFAGGGVPMERIFLVLFHANAPGELPLRVVEEQMGEFTAVVPYDAPLALRAENEGTVIQVLKPTGRMSRSLQSLAAAVSTRLTGGTAAEPVNEDAAQAWAHALEKKAIGQIWDALGRVDGLRSKTTLHLESLVENEFNAALLSVPGAPSTEAVERARQNVKDHVMGLGPLQKIMRDPLITEIMVNGETSIYIERDGRVHKTDDAFSNRAQLLTIIDRVVSGGGRRVDLSSPLCDARLPDGSRVNVVLPPVS
jgi:hypothetical protein